LGIVITGAALDAIAPAWKLETRDKLHSAYIKIQHLCPLLLDDYCGGRAQEQLPKGLAMRRHFEV
jgi:hypothetical protein